MSATGRHRLLLALLAAALFLPNLGGTDFWAPDEPKYAEVSREMLVAEAWGDRILPHLNGEVYTDKPPLLFWLIAAISSLAGQVTSLTARLPSALAGIAAVLLTREIGARLFDPVTALASGAVFATAFRVFDSARNAQIDMLLCALVAASMLCVVRARQDGSKIAAAGFWAFAALATLAKGPVGVLMPAGAVVAYVVASRSPRALLSLRPASGIAIFAAIAGGWLLAAQLAGGAEGYSSAGVLQKHVLSRFLEGLHHKRPVWYFFAVLSRELMPWALFLPGACLLAWRRWIRARDRGDLLLLCWFAFVLGFFTISAEKRNIYLVPLYPAAALMIGRLLVLGWKREPGPARESVGKGWVTWPAAIMAFLMTASALLALVASEESVRAAGGASAGETIERWSGVFGPLRLTLAVMLPGGVAALASLARRRTMSALRFIGAGAFAAYVCVAFSLGPAVNLHKSARPLAERVTAAIRAGLPEGTRIESIPSVAPSSETIVSVRSWRIDTPWLPLYSDGILSRRLDSGEELRRHVEAGARAFVVTESGERGAIEQKTGVPFDVLAAGTIGHRHYVLIRPGLGRSPVGSPVAGAP